MKVTVEFEKSPASSDKRLSATFRWFSDRGKIKSKKVLFGEKGGSTYIDHHDINKKIAYIARHKVREDFENYMSPGSLSRWILWEFTDYKKAVRNYVKMFGLLLLNNY
jgi:hypothetical protein